LASSRGARNRDIEIEIHRDRSSRASQTSGIKEGEGHINIKETRGRKDRERENTLYKQVKGSKDQCNDNDSLYDF